MSVHLLGAADHAGVVQSIGRWLAARVLGCLVAGMLGAATTVGFGYVTLPSESQKPASERPVEPTSGPIIPQGSPETPPTIEFETPGLVSADASMHAIHPLVLVDGLLSKTVIPAHVLARMGLETDTVPALYSIGEPHWPLDGQPIYSPPLESSIGFYMRNLVSIFWQRGPRIILIGPLSDCIDLNGAVRPPGCRGITDLYSRSAAGGLGRAMPPF